MPRYPSTIRLKVTAGRLLHRKNTSVHVVVPGSVHSVSHAAVLFLTVTTKEDGSFRLENMTAGTYAIRVNKELMFFEPITVKIAPSTPQLPDIITAGCDIPAVSSILSFWTIPLSPRLLLLFEFWCRFSTASASAGRSPSAACPRAWSSRDAIKWLWNTRTRIRPPRRPSILTHREFSAFRPNLETTASM